MTLLDLGCLLTLVSLTFGVLDAFDVWPDPVWRWLRKHDDGVYEFFGVGFFLGIAILLGSGIKEVIG